MENSLESMEEIWTEVPAVPIGTIEPYAQCTGGTGRKTVCKQHTDEVKILLGNSLTVVEINRDTMRQGSIQNTQSQNNYTELLDK